MSNCLWLVPSLSFCSPEKGKSDWQPFQEEKMSLCFCPSLLFPHMLPFLPSLSFALLALLFLAHASAFLLSSFILLDPFVFLSLSCMRSSDTLCCGSRSRQLSVYCKTARQKDFMSCERQLFPNELLTWCFTQASSPL